MKDQNYIDILVSQLKLRDGVYEGGIQELRDKAAKIARIRADYEKQHPEVIGSIYRDENWMEAQIQYRGDRIKKFFLTELKPFRGDINRIPDIPVLPVEWLRINVWPGLYRAGAIPKKDLIPGKEYLGSCRNSGKATWDGKVFWYTRSKCGNSYQESINHFEDDNENGIDIFIPIYEK